MSSLGLDGYYVTTLAKALIIRAIQNNRLGLPAPPAQIVGPRKKQIIAAWDGTGNPPFGWTTEAADYKKHPTLADTYAIRLLSADADYEATLTDVQKLALAAARAALVATLTSDWFQS